MVNLIGFVCFSEIGLACTHKRTYVDLCLKCHCQMHHRWKEVFGHALLLVLWFIVGTKCPFKIDATDVLFFLAGSFSPGEIQRRVQVTLWFLRLCSNTPGWPLQRSYQIQGIAEEEIEVLENGNDKIFFVEAVLNKNKKKLSMLQQTAPPENNYKSTTPTAQCQNNVALFLFLRGGNRSFERKCDSGLCRSKGIQDKKHRHI